MERDPSRRPDPTRHLARALSLTALLVCIAAFAGILVEGAAKAPAAAGGAAQVERLQASAARLAGELEALRPGRSAQRARRALHVALADNTAVASAIKRAEAAGMATEPRLANAVDAHFEYLDALGSVLSNPRSALRGRLPERARRVQAAFASLEGAGRLPRTISGWERVEALAAARRS